VNRPTKFYIRSFTHSWDIRGTLKILGFTWPRPCQIFGKTLFHSVSLAPAKTCAKFLFYSFIRSKDIAPNRMHVFACKVPEMHPKIVYMHFHERFLVFHMQLGCTLLIKKSLTGWVLAFLTRNHFVKKTRRPTLICRCSHNFDVLNWGRKWAPFIAHILRYDQFITLKLRMPCGRPALEPPPVGKTCTPDMRQFLQVFHVRWH